MAELADAYGLGPYEATCGGSTPLAPKFELEAKSITFITQVSSGKLWTKLIIKEGF